MIFIFNISLRNYKVLFSVFAIVFSSNSKTNSDIEIVFLSHYLQKQSINPTFLSQQTKKLFAKGTQKWDTLYKIGVGADAFCKFAILSFTLGKSAAMGLSVAAAIAFGYSNIFVTSPSPENLNTFFEFIFKGFDALEYQEHIDYELVQSTNPEFNKAIVRVNVFRDHRQTIQYIHPRDNEK